MDRATSKASSDPASYGAEALPAGFNEMSKAMHSEHSATQGGTPAQSTAPLVGLIALAAHWLKKHGGGGRA